MAQMSYPARIVGENIGNLCLVREVVQARFLRHMDWTGARYTDACIDHMGTLSDDECEDAATFLKLPKETLIGTHGIDGEPVSGTGEPLLPSFLTTGDAEGGKRLRQVVGQLTGNGNAAAVGQWLTRTLPDLQPADAAAILAGRRRISLDHVDRILRGLSHMAQEQGQKALQEVHILGPEWEPIGDFVRGRATPVIKNREQSVLYVEIEEHPPPAPVTVSAHVEPGEAAKPADQTLSATNLIYHPDEAKEGNYRPETLQDLAERLGQELRSAAGEAGPHGHSLAVIMSEVLSILRHDLAAGHPQSEALPSIPEEFLRSVLLLVGKKSLRGILSPIMKVLERAVIEEALRRAGGVQSDAARLLRIDYKTTRQKINEHGLRKREEPQS